jgi:hypothetical protein
MKPAMKETNMTMDNIIMKIMKNSNNNNNVNNNQ